MPHGDNDQRYLAECHQTILCVPSFPFTIPQQHTNIYFSAQMALKFRGKYQLLSPVHEDSITCVAFSIKGDYVASGGLGRRLHIFSLDDGKLHYSIVTTSSIKSLIWLPGPGAEQTLLCACHSGILMNIVIRPGVRDHIFTPLRLRSYIFNEGYHEYQLLSSKTSLD